MPVDDDDAGPIAGGGYASARGEREWRARRDSWLGLTPEDAAIANEIEDESNRQTRKALRGFDLFGGHGVTSKDIRSATRAVKNAERTVKEVDRLAKEISKLFS